MTLIKSTQTACETYLLCGYSVVITFIHVIWSKHTISSVLFKPTNEDDPKWVPTFFWFTVQVSFDVNEYLTTTGQHEERDMNDTFVHGHSNNQQRAGLSAIFHWTQSWTWNNAHNHMILARERRRWGVWTKSRGFREREEKHNQHPHLSRTSWALFFSCNTSGAWNPNTSEKQNCAVWEQYGVVTKKSDLRIASSPAVCKLPRCNTSHKTQEPLAETPQFFHRSFFFFLPFPPSINRKALAGVTDLRAPRGT